MPPVVNPAATIPYEIASDIEYAERRLELFDKWAFSDHHRAADNFIQALDAFGRIWGKLTGRPGFSIQRARPYAIQSNDWYGLTPPLVDAVMQKAVEVAAEFTDFCAHPLASLKGIDKQSLRNETARQERLLRGAKGLGELVRDLIQQDYIRLQPGDWVRVPYWYVVGRVAAVNHARVRVTTAERFSSMDRINTGYRYTSWDLVRVTLDKIPPPVPSPLCVPGLEWLPEVMERQRALDVRYQQKWASPHELQSHMLNLALAYRMVWLSEQSTEVDIALQRSCSLFPDDIGASFPDWMNSQLQKICELVGQDSRSQYESCQEMSPPARDYSPTTAQGLVSRCRGATDLLAHHIANQVGQELGAQLRVFGDFAMAVPEDEIEEGLHYPDPESRWATLVRQNSRTLTVEFDPDERVPGLHEVDITDVTA